MAQAYQQLKVDDDTEEVQTIMTHCGAFKCCHLQFGVCVVPGIFQSLMERLLQGILGRGGVIPYFDDIFVSAANEAELVICAVFNHFRHTERKLKQNKYTLGVHQVESH